LLFVGSGEKNTSTIEEDHEEVVVTADNSEKATDQVSEKLQKLNVSDGDKHNDKNCDTAEGDKQIEVKSEDVVKIESTSS